MLSLEQQLDRLTNTISDLRADATVMRDQLAQLRHDLEAAIEAEATA